MNKLLETRNKMKSKKPLFERQDANIFDQFRGQWRRPRGIHSKMRRSFKGHKDMPSIGWSSPRAVSGLTRKGLVPVVVSNVKDLEKVTSGCIAIISATVGMKKRVEILNKAKEKKLTVSTIKDIDAYLKNVADSIAERKKKSQSRNEIKKKRSEEAAKKVEEKKVEEKKNESKK